MTMHDSADYDSRIWNLAQGTADEPLERHVAGCDACQEQLATLQHLTRYARTTGGAGFEPPMALATQLSSLMRTVRPDLVAVQRPSGTMRLGDTIRRVIATLVADTGLTAQPAGLRSSTDTRTRQLVFESDLAGLDLEVSPLDGGESWAIVGQLGTDDISPGATISFVRAAVMETSPEPASPDLSGSIRMELSADGYFRGTLTGGAWTALADVGDALVIFREIRL